MTKSTFYHDGYKAALRSEDGTPPDAPVYADEYWDGYRDAMRSLEPFYKPAGPDDRFQD